MGNVHRNRLTLKFLILTILIFVTVGKRPGMSKDNLTKIKKIPNKRV